MSRQAPPTEASTPLADERGALQTRAHAADFLLRHPPFASLPRVALIDALHGARLKYCPRGTRLFGPEDGPPQHFYVVQQGLIRGTRKQHPKDAPETIFEAGPGDSLLIPPLHERRPTHTEHHADSDSFVFEISRAGFQRLLKEPGFRDYCERRTGALLDAARRQLRTRAGAGPEQRATLNSRLCDLIRREPVTCNAGTSVVDAVRRMHETRVGSIVIVDQDDHAAGIFTLHDLRALIADDGAGLQRPIGEVMTPSPVALRNDQVAFEAAMTMVDHGFGHLVITRGGRLTGVISQRDLFALRSVDLVHLSQSIRRAGSAAELAELGQRIRQLVQSLLAHGASATQLTRMITRLNDAIVLRTIALATEDQRVPGFTWLAFGSEARAEQGLITDQDNGMLFSDPSPDADSLRRELLPVAHRINEMLDRAGLPLCRGNVMASNPELCLSLSEWREKYRRIIATSTPENLLKATILLDCRCVHGDEAGVAELQRLVADQARGNTRFQHALAQDALQFRVPVGLWHGLVSSISESARTIDLKKNGLQLFVGAVRVLSLTHGIVEQNTEDRLQALADAGAISHPDAEAWAEAFSFIQLLRMRQHGDQIEAGQAPSNVLNPQQLNPLHRRILTEALRQARRLQTRLELDYP